MLDFLLLCFAFLLYACRFFVLFSSVVVYCVLLFVISSLGCSCVSLFFSLLVCLSAYVCVCVVIEWLLTLLLFASVSAPFVSTSHCAVSVWPYLHAKCNGVRPYAPREKRTTQQHTHTHKEKTKHNDNKQGWIRAHVCFVMQVFHFFSCCVFLFWFRVVCLVLCSFRCRFVWRSCLFVCMFSSVAALAPVSQCHGLSFSLF